LTPAERDRPEQLRLEREAPRLQNRRGAVQTETRHRGGNTFLEQCRSMVACSKPLLFAIAGLALAGCGGHAAKPASSTVRSTSVAALANPSPASAAVAEFHRRGQALCQGRFGAHTNGVTPEAFAALERRALASSASFYRQLEALNAPKSLAPYVQQYLTLQHHDDAVWRRIVARLDTGTSIPNAIAPDQTTITSDSEQGNALLTRLGLTDCVVLVSPG
jgi:hypothetical protein